MEEIIAYCGIDCSACPAYVATKRMILKNWKKLLNNGQMIQCHLNQKIYTAMDVIQIREFLFGVVNAQQRIVVWTNILKIVPNCEDYICDILKKSFENNDPSSKERLDAIRIEI